METTDTPTGDRIDPDAVVAAAEHIPPAFRNSPQFVSEPLSSAAGIPVVLKVETVNPIGCFKGRGTWLAMQALVRDEPEVAVRGVVVASAGNFGQGIAFAGRALGVPVTVVASERASRLKVERMRGLGATVIARGSDLDAAVAAAEELASRDGLRMLVDGREAAIAIGAGSIGVEVTESVGRGELPSIATAYVPVGNGALIGGAGAWLRHASPRTTIIGVQAAAAPAMTLSWRAGHAVDTPRADTIADGIATRVAIPHAVRRMLGVVDDMVLVEEDAIADACTELTDATGITVEPAAAVGWAALSAQPHDGPALLIVTGSNVAARSSPHRRGRPAAHRA